MKLYRQAGEATAWLILPAVGDGLADDAAQLARDPQLIEADSARRAKGELRRFARANRLTHLWTLTNGEAIYDYAEMARRVERFLERARGDGWSLPLVIVAEPHPEGHGWHLHAGADRFIPIKRVRAWWPYGHVFVRGPRRGRKGAWAPRKLATYLAKYVGKALGGDELVGCAPRPKGAHRYWRTQGFDPVPVRLRFRTLAQLVAWLGHCYGHYDQCAPFGLGESYRPEGWWLSFPDACLDPPPRGP